VSPDQITQTNPGEIFIHRNVANIVHPDDTNLMAVLQFAVDVLQVKHIVLCGHHGCGGIEATLKGGAEGPIHEWLEDTRRVYANHKAEVDGAGDMKARIDRLVECNVRDQLLDLAQSKTVKAAFDRGQPLLLHGWVYDIRDGLLKPLMEIDKDTDLNPDKAPDTVLLKEKES